MLKGNGTQQPFPFLILQNTMTKHHITLTLLLFTTLTISAQSNFRVMFYNVENLFDCTNNPEKNDSEYTPQGARKWTKGRYYHKLQQISKVITAAGRWSTPALIGLCEVENDSTLIHLLTRTPLRSQYYRYVITNSPDKRGINVALLYQRDKFAYIHHECLRIHFQRNKGKQSRDILHVYGKVLSGDTLDVFVCHLPSRSGGEKNSEPDRYEAILVLKAQTDSLIRCRKNPNIVIMGDFNDTPTDKNICQVLGAIHPKTPGKSQQLYNLFAPPVKLSQKGSHKFQGEWNLLDQFIVSGNLLDTKKPLHIIPNTGNIFCEPFMLTKDKTHLGLRSKRTFHGYKYEGGYSDHLPIIVDFSISLPPK